MNKLTINRVALGSIRRRRGQYKAIILGAGLAIFFVSSLFLAVQSVYETQRLAHIARVGRQDAVILDADRDPLLMRGDTVPATPEALLESGKVSDVGSVFVIAETADTKCPIGYYDEPGAEMANPQLREGRLPENPGEIAVEMSFLQKLRSEAQLGDDIELTLRIPLGRRAQFLETPIKKTYKIIGILKPRSSYIVSNYVNDWEYLAYPSAIVSDKEPIELGGRAIVHRLVLFAPGTSPIAFEKYPGEAFDAWSAVVTAYSLFQNQYGTGTGTAGIVLAVIAIMLGVILTLCACLGIVNAFSGSLSERRSQIGMMRAVGATSRQIRSIFGREAVLLSLLIAPVAIALSYLFVWGLCSRIGIITFYANPLFLPLNALASLLCVALASWVPLISASKLLPMQAIRDVSLLRTRKRARIKAKSHFSAPRLIAMRHLRLYKTKQAGVCAMVALSMLMLSIAVPFVANLWGSTYPFDYRLYTYRWQTDSFIEQDVNPHEGLNDADVSEIRMLPGVVSVDTFRRVHLNLLMDTVSPYAAINAGFNYWHAAEDEYSQANIRSYEDFKADYDLTQEAFPAQLSALEDTLIESLAPHVLHGRIDIDALNAGREVLVYAPETCYQYAITTPDGGQYLSAFDQPPRRDEPYTSYTNDAFHAGDGLKMLRLYTRGGLKTKDDGGYDMLTGVTRQEARTKIGAVLGKDMDNLPDELYFYGISATNLFTTHAGLRSLGLESVGYVDVNVRLSSELDDEIHKYLTDALTAIAARGDMEIWNNVESAKESAFWQVILKASMVAVLLLMLSMCVTLVNSAITGRIRSEKRAIGTLRAVGAQLSDIVKSYRLQALSMVSSGILIGAFLSALYFAWYLRTGIIGLAVPFHVLVLSQAAFLGAAALLCGINLSLRIREITRESIVSNIREL